MGGYVWQLLPHSLVVALKQFQEIMGRNPESAEESVVADNAAVLLDSGFSASSIKAWKAGNLEKFGQQIWYDDLSDEQLQESERFYRSVTRRDPEPWDHGVVENIFWIRHFLGDRVAARYVRKWDFVDGGKPCGSVDKEELLCILDERQTAKMMAV